MSIEAEIREAVREELAAWSGGRQGLLTIKEAAAYLQVSIPVVRRWERSGELPAADLGDGEEKRALRFRTADLDRFVERRIRRG